MELGHLLTRSGLTYPEVSSKVYCPSSFRETFQWLKFPLNGLGAQSRVSPVVGLLPLASGPAYLVMAFPPFLVKHLYHCDSVVISSFVRTGYTTRRWGWLLGRIGYSITHHYPLYPFNTNRDVNCIMCCIRTSVAVTVFRVNLYHKIPQDSRQANCTLRMNMLLYVIHYENSTSCVITLHLITNRFDATILTLYIIIDTNMYIIYYLHMNYLRYMLYASKEL